MSTENPLLARFIEEPSMVAPEWTASLEANITFFLQLEHAVEMLAVGDGTAQADSFWPEADSWQAKYRPYSVADGVLSIPIAGVMLNNMSYATPYATGYQYIAKAWARGMADPDVKGIALNINSGGGDAAGNLDLVDKMVATKTKPVKAIAENAYSAAYAIATAADTIDMSRTGGVGSIGVVVGHQDHSDAMKQRGVKMTFITAPAGGDKVDGNPYERLSDGAKERMQDRVDELYQHFVDTVSQNRGMDEKAIRATKARTFTASKATSNGLADKVTPSDDSMAAFLADLKSNDGEDSMTVLEKGTVAAAAHEAAVADARTDGTTAGHAAGLADGLKAAGVRIAAILASDAAKDRQVAAMALALDPDMATMTADAIGALLAKLPVEKPAAEAVVVDPHKKPEFVAGMNGGGAHVESGKDDEKPDTSTPEAQVARALTAAAVFGIPGMRSSVAAAEARQ